MVFNKEMDDFEKEMAYDLRKVYAVELIGEHLKDIAHARKSDNYAIYLKSLRDLFIITQHKFLERDKKIEEYKRLLKIAVDKANKHKEEFIGSSKNPVACWEIEEALNNIEMFLYTELEDAGVFGTKWEDKGL